MKQPQRESPCPLVTGFLARWEEQVLKAPLLGEFPGVTFLSWDVQNQDLWETEATPVREKGEGAHCPFMIWGSLEQ